MKRLIQITCILFISFQSFADQLTFVEKWQAEKAASYLQGEKYIISYCDCCNEKEAYLIKIENASFEPTGNMDTYCVRIRGKKIAEIKFSENQQISETQNISEPFNNTIDLAYTFAQVSGLAMPVGLILDFDMNSCLFFIGFPNKQNIEYPEYSGWFKQNIENSMISINSIYGSWNITAIYTKDEIKIVPFDVEKAQRFVFKPNGSFFTNVGNGESGNFEISNNKIILIIDPDNSRVENDVVLFNNTLYIKFNLPDKITLLKLTKS